MHAVRALGLYSAAEERAVAGRLEAEDEALRLAERTSLSPAAAAPILAAAGSSPLAHGVRVAEVAKRQGVGLADLLRAAGVGDAVPAEAMVTAELELKYAGYFARERQAAERLARLGAFALAPDLPYA